MAFLSLLIAQLAEFLAVHHLPAVFAGTFLFGDAVVITAFVLALRLEWSIALVFLVAMAATLMADTAWFFLGKRVFELLERKQAKLYQKYEEKVKAIDASLPFRRPWLVLLYFKFLQGTRIFIIIYLSTRNIRYRKFILLDAIGAAAWLSSLFGLSYLIFTGVRVLLPYVEGVFLVFTALFVAFVLLRIMYRLIGKRLRKKN